MNAFCPVLPCSPTNSSFLAIRNRIILHSMEFPFIAYDAACICTVVGIRAQAINLFIHL
jgi:hypothetical protein